MDDGSRNGNGLQYDILLGRYYEQVILGEGRAGQSGHWRIIFTADRRIFRRDTQLHTQSLRVGYGHLGNYGRS